ncbi:hypothetical protein DQ04_01051080 [Trypanosoma grayi]|uniref:hypothetical protein n=1 Tax=Trypanosoma grayi TaxID=71804 RepID=UPI0004F48EAE|nr:hypothetical protein DQ04_01051080 [Trypanosoma grayi]KEG13355.1 hypothetical protein DQ04_01051080 [Trypanosoma grayi]
MDENLVELQGRLTAAEDRVRKMTHLMLRAVWQYVIHHRTSPISVKNSCVSGAREKVRPGAAVPRQVYKKSDPTPTQRRKSKGGVADQARLSRELYRTAFGAARQQVEEEATLGNSEENGKCDGVPSVALLLLQSSRQRAIMALFLLRLRLAVHQRRFLHAECEMRYNYYKLRRTLRAWHQHARASTCRRRRILEHVLQHWVGFVQRRRRKQDILRRFCAGLVRRLHAFEAVRGRKLQQCFMRWRQRLDVCRMVRGMEECATKMRRRHKYIEVDSTHLRAGGFLIMDRVFSHWKGKTERRLDARLAELMYRRLLLRHSWNKLVWQYEFARQQHTPSPSSTSCEEVVVHVDPQPGKLMVFKDQCAEKIAQGRLKKAAFVKWRSHYRNMLSDCFFVFSRRVRVLEAWMQALRRQRAARLMLKACWWRWRQRLHCRLQYIQSLYWRRLCLLRRAMLLWRDEAASRHLCNRHALQSCWGVWWRRAMLCRAQRRLAVGAQRRALLAWRGIAAREKQYRTMSCLAESLRELVLLVGCFRRWKGRHEHACRVRLAEGILGDLRREKQRARLFQRWKRLTFWPRAGVKAD